MSENRAILHGHTHSRNRAYVVGTTTGVAFVNLHQSRSHNVNNSLLFRQQFVKAGEGGQLTGCPFANAVNALDDTAAVFHCKIIVEVLIQWDCP